MVAILLAAAVLRLHALPGIPPGMTHDEADHGLDAWGIVQGDRPIYLTTGYGREPLFDYSTALLMSFLGPTYLAGRLTAVFFGLFLVAGMGAWTRRAFDEQAALLAAAGLAVAFWPLMTARQALRTVTMPALFVPGLLSFWRGMDATRHRRRAWPFWAAAGVWLGLSLYTYIPARVAWLLLPATAAYLWLRRAPQARRIAAGAALTVLVALALGLPLFAYLAAHPGAEVRIEQLAGPLRQVLEGNFEPLFGNARAALGLFSGRGDSAWRYNIAGRPWLPLLPALLFYGGLLLAGWQAARARPRRGAAAWTALVWLLLGLSPALVTGPELSTTQAIAAQPVLFLFPALALVAAMRWLAPKVGQPAPRLLLLAALPLFGGWLLTTYRAYFTEWASRPEVAVQYEADLVEAVRYLDTLEAQTVTVGTDAPGRLHDPATAALFRTGDAVTLRWFDARYSLLLAAAAGKSSLFLTTAAPLAPALQPYLDTVATVSATLPQGRYYHVDNRDGFQQLYPQFSRQTHSFSTELSTGADFGGVVRWLGLAGPASGSPGETATLTTLWEVTGAAPPDLVLFLQLLDEDGQPAAQVDRLDAPSDQWRVGDHFVQLHEVILPAPGRYPVAVGIYPAADWRQRLPVVADGAAVGDMLLLPALEVRP